MADKIKYVPTEEAKKNPRSLRIDGELRAIGGSIETKPKPPKIGTVIKECTQAQYKKLHELKGYKDRLITIVKDGGGEN